MDEGQPATGGRDEAAENFPAAGPADVQAFLNALPDQAWMKDTEGRYVMANCAFLRTLDRTADEIEGATDEELLDDPPPIFMESDRKVVEGGARVTYEHWGAGPSDPDARYESVKTPVRNAAGEVVAIVGVSRDVTDRYRRERRLKEARAHYRRLTETSPYGVFVTDAQGMVREANPALARLLGRTVDELEGSSFLDFVAPRSREYAIERFQSRTSGVSEIELWIERPDGTERRIVARSTRIREDGEIVGSHGVVRDVTEEREVAESHQRLADVVEAAPYVVAIRDTEGNLLYTNGGGSLSNVPMVGSRDWASVTQAFHPEWAARRVLEEGLPTARERGHWTGETAMLGPDGQEIPLEQTIIAGRDEDGEITHYSAIMRDISPLKAREQALERRDRILEAVSRVGTDMLRSTDLEAVLPEGLRRLGEATGVSRVSVLRLSRRDGRPRGHLRHEWAAPGIEAMADNPAYQDIDAQEAGMDRWVRVLEAGQSIFGAMSELPPREQAFLDAQNIQSVAAVPIEVHGAVWGMLVFDDCEEPRSWESTEIEALRAAAGAIGAALQRIHTDRELAEREEQLRQSQKMEAVGRLAGGVAHDFNNMLTAIQGFATLLRTEVPADGPGGEYLEEVARAAERSATLTRQLLAFSRKQVMRRSVVDLNRSIEELDRMLTRLLGETVTLETRLEDDPFPVLVDESQFEQVIVNLAVNARDAMPDGGTLRITTGNVRVDRQTAKSSQTPMVPGDYLEVCVSDTGIGIPPEVQERVFEPFFTTKGAGEGTGLGLSTVYGIVEQSDGVILVDSEVGQGTTFRLYFPRTDETEREELHERGTEDDVKAAPGRTVLVVEDEAAVRRLIQKVLEADGYTVLTAEHGTAGLDMARNHAGPIDLMVTDVVMPEMAGPELGQAVKELRPDCTVCYMSGYTEHEMFRHGLDPESDLFIEKPFTPDSLLRSVRELLSDSPDDGDQPG